MRGRSFLPLGIFFLTTPWILNSQTIPLSLKQVVQLEEKRAPAGKLFSFTVTLPKDRPMKSVDVFFEAGRNKVPTQTYVTKEASVEENEKLYTLEAKVPDHGRIFAEVERKLYEGWWSPRVAQTRIEVHLAEETITRTFPFAVPLVSAAAFWGVVTVLLLLGVLALLKPNPFSNDSRFSDDARHREWTEQAKLKRFLLYPLNFAITPISTYSISAVQVVFWTLIIIFAAVFVFVTHSDFLPITDQVLILLGISGGTALAAKANALMKSKDIPKEYFSDIKRSRFPKLRDLVTIGGVPNIFKFQIFAFTLINGVIVLKELCSAFAFPVIPTEQLTLMGISSAIYLGNEVTMENVWEKIEEKVKKAEEIQNKQSDKYKKLKGEIQDLLEPIYQAI
jgi:hypothetical protein